MNEFLDEVVRDVIARHLDVDVSEVDPLGHLQADLHLDPLDLVLIALRLEDLERREFPIHRLEYVQTVADLADVVMSMREASNDEAIFTLDQPSYESKVVPAPRSEARLSEARNGRGAPAATRAARARAERAPTSLPRRSASR